MFEATTLMEDPETSGKEGAVGPWKEVKQSSILTPPVCMPIQPMHRDCFQQLCFPGHISNGDKSTQI